MKEQLRRMTVFQRYTCDLDLPKIWPDAHCIRGNVPCSVKRPVPSKYYMVQGDLIDCLEKLSVTVNYA